MEQAIKEKKKEKNISFQVGQLIRSSFIRDRIGIILNIVNEEKYKVYWFDCHIAYNRGRSSIIPYIQKEKENEQ